MDLPRLTYFSSRGRAEPARLVLALAGVRYDERNVGVWKPGDLPAEFLSLQREGALAFDALPLWEEPGGLRLVQSDAIVRHLGRAHGLYGANAQEASRIDEAYEGVNDARGALGALRGAADKAAARVQLADVTLPRWAGHFERLLGRNRGGFGLVGSGPTIADSALFHWVESVRDNELGAALDPCPQLVAWEQRMRSIPRFRAWIESPTRFAVQRLG